MAIDKTNYYKTIIDKIESLVMDKIFKLEDENAKLRADLASANAKLEVYERIATISDSKSSIGFGPPINKEGGM